MRKVIVDSSSFGDPDYKLKYYGQYKFEVLGGVGFGSSNSYFESNTDKVLVCEFEIVNPCFDPTSILIQDPGTLIHEQLTSQALED